jgi:hypothetical protein
MSAKDLVAIDRFFLSQNTLQIPLCKMLAMEVMMPMLQNDVNVL